MGQKTNPKGFRLVTTQGHLSKWYSNKLEYSNLIQEDYFIRSKVQEFLSTFLSISKIEIHRILAESQTKQFVTITIHALFPRVKEMSRKVSNQMNETSEKNSPKNKTLLSNSNTNVKNFATFLMKQKIRSLIRFLQKNTSKNYYVNIQFIRNPFEDATLIAKYISEQLEKRIPFRRAVKQTIKKVQRTEMKGIKVQVSGRLNGIDIARSEWKRDGRVPLHTLRAKIDYTHEKAETIYGVIGIKVWLFQGEM